MTKTTDWNTGKETDWPMPEEGTLEKKILSISDIDDLSESGQLLLMSISKLSTESQPDKEPDELLNQIQDLRVRVYTEEMINKIKHCRKTDYNPAYEPPAGFVHPVPKIK